MRYGVVLALFALSMIPDIGRVCRSTAKDPILRGLALYDSATTPGGAVQFFTLATFGAGLTITPSWVHCADLARKNAGNAPAYFFVAAALDLLGMWCWFRMHSVNQE